jgi:hypothetical protein
VAMADITITVLPSIAPNADGSPSFAGYLANANYALENNLSSLGTPGTPTYYSQLSNGATVQGGDAAVTSFHSWQGQLNPTGAFANEDGNRIHFGVEIVGTKGSTFSLSQLRAVMTSSDPNAVDLTYSNGVGAHGSLGLGSNFLNVAAYTPNKIGIIHNADGSINHLITSGDSTQLVDEIVYVGIGNAWWPNVGTPGEQTPFSPGATETDAMNNYYAFLNANGGVDVATTYYLVDANNNTIASGTASVDVVPAPAAVLLGLLGLSGLAAFKRRFAK